MKYPDININDLEYAVPVRKLTEVIASRERNLIPKHNSQPWSLRLGALCLLADERNNQHIRAALNETKKNTDLPTVYNFIPQMLTFKNNISRLQQEQQLLHGAVIEELTPLVLKEDKGQYANTIQRGRIAELTTLGLLTRYAHPWVIAVPTLPHHDADLNKSFHFDIALAIQDGNNSTGHMLQVKSSCIGRCDGDNPLNINSYYAPSIQLVSGCCDLGFEYNGFRGMNYDTARDLANEYYDSASTAEIKRLDVLTDNLLLNTTSDLLPRGTYSPTLVNV